MGTIVDCLLCYRFALDIQEGLMSSTAVASPTTLTPVPPEERIVVLDVLRGFALLGILTVNLPGAASSGYAWAAGLDPFPGWWDKAAEWIVTTFFAGKFNSIFSFLFGLGFTIQLMRASERGANVTAVYLRRIAILFALGVAHALLIWNGDVLHMYALLGLALLALRRVSDKTVFALILAALLLPGARAAYSAITQEPWSIARESMPARYEEETRIYQTGTYAEQVGLRYRQLAEAYGLITDLRGPVMFYSSLLMTMLFGFYVGRRRIIQDLPQHAGWIKRVMVWCFAIGLVAAVIGASLFLVMEPTGRGSMLGFFAGMMFTIQRPLLCLFYIAGIALLSMKSERWRTLFAPLAIVGRMPLTNYLMQSVVFTTLLYSWGFGLYGRLGPAACLAVTAVIFAVQVLYSRWWMARFRFGPLEWLWRGATYGHFPALRAAGSGAAAAATGH
jgi:uncharacterized protein